MRKLASIVRIKDCTPIPETDRLSVTTMEGKGWNIVTSRDEYKPGDLAVYFEIDSYLPAEDERYAFLKERCLKKFVSKSGSILREGIRIKSIKLRGVVSQGLLMPIDVFPEILNRTSADKTRISLPDECELGVIVADFIGADVSALLKVEHYDEVKEQLSPACGGNPISADAMGKFPSNYCPKTDEERIQNLSAWFDKFKDMEWEVTSKDDGSSLTMFYSPTIDSEIPFGVCTRNLRIKSVDSKGVVPLGYQMASKYDVEAKLKAYTEETKVELAFQGELVGPGIQKDRDKYLAHEWHIFKVYDITHQHFLLPEERRDLCQRLGFTHVEVVSPAMKVFTEYPTIETMLQFAEGKTARGNEREGLVFKSTTERNLSFKCVSNKYLLKQD